MKYDIKAKLTMTRVAEATVTRTYDTDENSDGSDKITKEFVETDLDMQHFLYDSADWYNRSEDIKVTVLSLTPIKNNKRKELSDALVRAAKYRDAYVKQVADIEKELAELPE